jgi:HD superfamily phosphohydrolase
VPLEQILFSKMMLFGSVYHHQKVKCLDSMLRSVIQHIQENPDRCAIHLPSARVSFAEPVEYLYITDDEFFNQIQGLGDAYVQEMVSRFLRRNLFVRCLQISRRTVVNWNHYGRAKLMDVGDQPTRLDDLERKIHEQLPASARSALNRRDVRLSIPDRPQIKTEDAVVQTSPGEEPEPIERFFPVGQWTDAYAHNKWSSYVYAPREHASAVRDAAISVLAEEVGLGIAAAKSNRACHLP